MATDYFSKKIDDKRRLTIPVDLYDEFASGVVVCQDPDERCLDLYSLDEWNQIIEPALKMRDDLPVFSPENQEVKRLNTKLRMGKLDAAMDGKQGRITLTADLMEYAGLRKEIKVVRAFPGKTYFQIYDVDYEL
jgi:MraZ protein